MVWYFSYTDDDTSPLFCDPLYAEEYTYSILSKTLGKKTAPQVAKPANQVREVEGVSTAAHKAVHKETAGVSRARNKSTSSSTIIATTDPLPGSTTSEEQSGGVATATATGNQEEVGQSESPPREQEGTVCTSGDCGGN